MTSTERSADAAVIAEDPHSRNKLRVIFQFLTVKYSFSCMFEGRCKAVVHWEIV